MSTPYDLRMKTVIIPVHARWLKRLNIGLCVCLSRVKFRSSWKNITATLRNCGIKSDVYYSRAEFHFNLHNFLKKLTNGSRGRYACRNFRRHIFDKNYYCKIFSSYVVTLGTLNCENIVQWIHLEIYIRKALFFIMEIGALSKNVTRELNNAIYRFIRWWLASFLDDDAKKRNCIALTVSNRFAIRWKRTGFRKKSKRVRKTWARIYNPLFTYLA